MQDKMTGADIKLTDEQVDLVHRLQKGQFGDVNFNPYEVGSWHSLCLCPRAGVGRAGATGLTRCLLSLPLTSSPTR